MALIEYSMDAHVAVITLNHEENRFNPQFLEAFLVCYRPNAPIRAATRCPQTGFCQRPSSLRDDPTMTASARSR